MNEFANYQFYCKYQTLIIDIYQSCQPGKRFIGIKSGLLLSHNIFHSSDGGLFKKVNVRPAEEYRIAAYKDGGGVSTLIQERHTLEITGRLLARLKAPYATISPRNDSLFIKGGRCVNGTFRIYEAINK